MDNFACFVAPAKVLLAWTDDESDPQVRLSACGVPLLLQTPHTLCSLLKYVQRVHLCQPQYERSKTAYDVLAASPDAKGRKIEVVKMLVPPPQHITEVTCTAAACL